MQKQKNKKTENHFMPDKALFYTHSLNTPLIPTHPLYQ